MGALPYLPRLCGDFNHPNALYWQTIAEAAPASDMFLTSAVCLPLESPIIITTAESKSLTSVLRNEHIPAVQVAKAPEVGIPGKQDEQPKQDAVTVAKADKAIADCTEAIRLNPQDARAFYSRGLAYGEKRDDEKQIADCMESLRLDPNFAEAYQGSAMALNEEDYYSMAAAFCTTAIRLKPEFAPAFLTRGEAYAMKGQLDLAVADFTEAIRLDAECAAAYKMRGRAYREKGDEARADADFENAKRLEKGNDVKLKRDPTEHWRIG